MIAVFAAMSRELAGLARCLVDRERTPVGGYPARLGDYSGKPVLLCRTGIGRRTESAVRVVLDHYQPSLVLSAGLGGALNPGLRGGDLVLCESVRPVPSEDANATPICSDEELLCLAEASAKKAGLRVWSGQSLTTDHIVGEPAEKDALRRSLGLDLVEMESYWVGLVAWERGLPFMAARVVLDELGDRLPELSDVVEADGSQRTFRALPYVLRHPGQVPWLLRTAVSERRSLANLTLFLDAFLEAYKVPLLAKSVCGSKTCQET